MEKLAEGGLERETIWHLLVNGGASGKEPACQCRRLRHVGSIPESRRSPGEWHGYPLQYSCLENPMDRGARRGIAHAVTKSQTRLKQLTMHVRSQWQRKAQKTPQIGWGSDRCERPVLFWEFYSPNPSQGERKWPHVLSGASFFPGAPDSGHREAWMRQCWRPGCLLPEKNH